MKEPRKKMKILFVTYHGLGFGGAEVSTKYLAEGLKKRGHEIIFASTGDYEGFKNYKLKDYRKIPFFFVHNLYMRKKIKQIILDEKPDLIHVHDRLTSVPAIQIAKKMKIPAIVHFRDYWFACPNSSCMARDGFEYDKCSMGIILKHFPMKRWLWDLYKLQYLKRARKILDKADLKFANSDSVKRRLEICGIKDYKTVNILRDLSKFSDKVEKNVIKKRFGLNKNVIAYVGGFTQVKGIMFVLPIVNNIIKGRKDWSFFIAGHGDLENEMREFARNNNADNVVIAGKLDIKDMPYVYRDSDIILLPSLWDEPLSGILLEGGASGKLVIASDKGGNKEVIADGKNGLIAHSGDENAWKEKIIIALGNQWARKGYGENLRKDVLKNYSLDKVSEIVEKEYKSILKAHQ